jgi:hypothetical protein
MAAVITERIQSLLDERGGDLRIFLQPFRDAGFGRIELAAALTLWG